MCGHYFMFSMGLVVIHQSIHRCWCNNPDDFNEKFLSTCGWPVKIHSIVWLVLDYRRLRLNVRYVRTHFTTNLIMQIFYKKQVTDYSTYFILVGINSLYIHTQFDIIIFVYQQHCSLSIPAEFLNVIFLSIQYKLWILPSLQRLCIIATQIGHMHMYIWDYSTALPFKPLGSVKNGLL